MSMLTEKLLMTKKADAMTLPNIVTSRSPNLLTNALATGPIHAPMKYTAVCRTWCTILTLMLQYIILRE